MRRARRTKTDAATPDAPAAVRGCDHLLAAARADEPPPQAADCQGCAELGEENWAHLRMCLTCGYVGCCDSSPRRHATGHFQSTEHPVMRSFEPGEQWRWCYVDVELQP